MDIRTAERRRKATEKMRQWRAKNPDRAKATQQKSDAQRRADGRAAEATRRWQIKFPEKVKAKAARQRERDRTEIITAKSVPCIDCGGVFPHFCMDFDHVRGDKLANIAHMIPLGYTREQRRLEISKCDVVCANCHRIRTAQRAGYLNTLRDSAQGECV